jgi:hypothetical protein
MCAYGCGHKKTGSTGVWGWADRQRVGYFLLLGLLIGVCGFVGLNFSIKYVSPLVCSTVLLADAPVTGLIAWWMGIEGVPSTWTCVGGAVVLIGIAAVTLGEQARLDAQAIELATVQPSIPVIITAEEVHGQLQEEFRGHDFHFEFGNLDDLDAQDPNASAAVPGINAIGPPAVTEAHVGARAGKVEL